MNRIIAFPLILAVGSALSQAAPVTPTGVEWIPLDGGRFMMKAVDADADVDEKPVHMVSIKPFKMSKTEVTVEQYSKCVLKGACTAPDSNDERCNWGKPGRQRHPVNCVDWRQAARYAAFAGARLPSEAEWEYAARSGGKNRKYPLGGEPPTCARTVFSGKNSGPCEPGRWTMPVCSKPAGNTEQGLCDMAGNVSEWTQDEHQTSYDDAPTDGSAFEGTGSPLRVTRGGGFGSPPTRGGGLMTTVRYGALASNRHPNEGFRIALGR